MSVEINTPEIRFKGFSEEWVKQELGSDIAEIIGGGTPSTLISEFWGGDIDWYSPTEIGHSVYAKGSEKKITALGLKSSSAKVLPAANTILFTSRAGIGDMAILAKQGTTNQGFQSLVVKDGFSPYFIYSAGKQIKEFALKHASGSTFLEISGKQLGRMQLLVPKNKEQNKIGNTFQKLDSLINKHQQKHDKLSKVKKAMLAKMFPKQGETIPEIRFKGFTGEWKETELGDVFAYERPDNYIVSSTEYSNKYSTPVLTANKGFLLGYTHEKSTYDNPSIIFDDFTLDSKFVDFPYMVKSSALKILTIKDNKQNDLLFAFHLLSTTRIEVLGHARHYIGIVQKTKVNIPKKEEQTAIGNYFQKLDSLINQHQQQITKLKKIKQACLSKMFV